MLEPGIEGLGPSGEKGCGKLRHPQPVVGEGTQLHHILGCAQNVRAAARLGGLGDGLPVPAGEGVMVRVDEMADGLLFQIRPAGLGHFFRKLTNF